MNKCRLPERQIMVVDDEPLIRETVTMLLESDGHHVKTASSGQEALVLFQPGKFDLVFTDYFMPAMTGDELAATIKGRSPGQTIVMLTAFPEKLQSPKVRAVSASLLMQPLARTPALHSGFPNTVELLII